LVDKITKKQQFVMKLLLFYFRMITFVAVNNTTLTNNMEKIDNLDRKILEIVMRNARIASKDVATECGVSRAAIHQRIQRMIDLKVITGSGYHVNPKILGYRTCTYIGVNLERGAMYKDVVPELEKIPEIVECHFTTGPYTMLIKLYARDNEHLMELLNDKIQMISGVTGTETLISLDHSIDREIPIHYK
jgi:Lrp/AsnC family transcriptional regulator for asnA, asnC and gidA